MTMRNRKTVIVAFVILALMLVSVGYAAITGSLTIEGTASSTAQKFNVVFTKAEVNDINDSQDDGAAVVLSVQNTKLTETVGNNSLDIPNLFTVSMTASGLATTDDYVTVTYTIQNNNKVPMKLTPVITGASVFSVTGGFADGDDADSELDATTVVTAEGGTTTYTVTVSLADDGYDTKKSETFTITINGTSEV